jgi:hypothetical protein
LGKKTKKGTWFICSMWYKNLQFNVWINKNENKDWGKMSFMQPKHWKPHPCHLKREGSFSYTIFYRSNAFQQNNNIIVQDGYKVHSISITKPFILLILTIQYQILDFKGSNHSWFFLMNQLVINVTAQQQNLNSI